MGFEPLISALDLPDPDGHRVLRLAESLRQWDIDPKDADDFVCDQIGLDAKVVWSCVQQIANSWRTPPGTIGDVLASLERCGLVQSVAELRAL
ncbi:hypothetical protein ACWGE0_26510 [Lentzea sp. NPDC054927]